MIELEQDRLVVSFPEVHPSAVFGIDFQRTLRIPDDGNDHFLPPGLGRFPLRHIDDHVDRAPESWLARGGVLLPMYQSEALWLNFSSLPPRPSQRAGPGAVEHRRWSGFPYPFALKIAAGKINAVTGEPWSDGLHRDPQDYVVHPEQPWLDGFCVEKGIIRQFVAMPLGAGYSAEEQVTGEAQYGGLQIIAYPMKADAYEKRVERWEREGGPRRMMFSAELCESAEMGLAPGGRMRQEIYDDPYDFDEWDTRHASRCFIHIANSLVWRKITGEDPPTTPPTAAEYTRAGLPWFDHYRDDLTAVEGSETLDGLDSVATLGKKKGDTPLPENESVQPGRVVVLGNGRRPRRVREGEFSA